MNAFKQAPCCDELSKWIDEFDWFDFLLNFENDELDELGNFLIGMSDDSNFLAWDILVFIIRREGDKNVGIHSLMPTPGSWRYRFYYFIGREIVQVCGLKSCKMLVKNGTCLSFIGMRLLTVMLKYVEADCSSVDTFSSGDG